MQEENPTMFQFWASSQFMRFYLVESITRREIRGVYWYRGGKKGGFFPPKLFFGNIFSQTCFTLLIFLWDARITLSAPFKYIQHCSTTSRKFFKTIWKKVSSQKHAMFGTGTVCQYIYLTNLFQIIPPTFFILEFW